MLLLGCLYIYNILSLTLFAHLQMNTCPSKLNKQIQILVKDKSIVLEQCFPAFLCLGSALK